MGIWKAGLDISFPSKHFSRRKEMEKVEGKQMKSKQDKRNISVLSVFFF